MIGIYKITNILNGHSYIGQSICIEKRITTHFWAAYKENLPSYNNYLYQVIRKYGKENFKWEILETMEEVDKSKLNKLEKRYIEKYNTYLDGYNMTSGGEGAEQNLDSGEKNGMAKLTKKDIVIIRELYNNRIIQREAYKLYKDRIGKSGFHKIWNWETWKNILPEYHNEENIKWHSTKARALSSEQASLNAGKIKKEDVLSIRELYDLGLSPSEILEKLSFLPIKEEEVRKIANKEKFKSF